MFALLVLIANPFLFNELRILYVVDLLKPALFAMVLMRVVPVRRFER